MLVGENLKETCIMSGKSKLLLFMTMIMLVIGVVTICFLLVTSVVLPFCGIINVISFKANSKQQPQPYRIVVAGTVGLAIGFAQLNFSMTNFNSNYGISLLSFLKYK